jgi:Phosphate transporter family
MNLYFFAMILLAGFAAVDLMVGVSNDAVNFLNSAIGSRVAPRYVIMIVASLGILAGVTFSSGMMEVARKGIFHPQFFLMPELITIFLAVMFADVLLLDLFNTFGLPTSTTVSIVFELLGAAVAVSLLKIHEAGESYAMLVEYINTGKALAIIMGILVSVVVAFVSGVIFQFLTRLLFTFNYPAKLRRYGGIWGGIALSLITYFILIKGAKGASFITSESVFWIDTHTLLILSSSFLFFGALFQSLTLFTRINILKPVVLAGTFALAMAFAANDLVNFIGVPLAGMGAYQIATASGNPLTVAMEALQKPIQTNTFLLLIAGGIMVTTLWISRKARTVTKTEVSLGRQDEGIERFGSSFISRIIVGMVYTFFEFFKKLAPVSLKKGLSTRLDPEACRPAQAVDGEMPSFDLLRASVNLILASALISFATSLKLPLSTTYVTFMVAMGSSFSDQAWGRESAVYRVTGVITVIGGWFFTALAAFTISLIFGFLIKAFELPAILTLMALLFWVGYSTYRFHQRKEREEREIRDIGLKEVSDADTAIRSNFEQTGHFLKDISDNLGVCFESAFSEDHQRIRNTRSESGRMQQWANTLVANLFNTLSLIDRDDISIAQSYPRSIRSLQEIAESHRDVILRTYAHFENYHSGFLEDQKEELGHVKAYVTRLLWNTSIMLMRRKKIDYAYIASQCRRLKNLVSDCEKREILRIQNGESKTRLSMLYYGFLEDCVKISEETRNLLDIFRESFGHKNVGS